MNQILSEFAEIVGVKQLDLETKFAALKTEQRRFDPLSYCISTLAFEFGVDVRGSLNLIRVVDPYAANAYEESFNRVNDFLVGLSNSAQISSALTNCKEFVAVVVSTMKSLWESSCGRDPYIVNVVNRQVSAALALTQLYEGLTPAHVRLQESFETILWSTKTGVVLGWTSWILPRIGYLADRRDKAFYHPSEEAFAAYVAAVAVCRTSAEQREHMLEIGLTMDDYRAYYERISRAIDKLEVDLMLYPLQQSVSNYTI